MKSEIPMREYVIRTILQDAMNCVFTEIMSIRNRLSQRLCRDAIYCVLQNVSTNDIIKVYTYLVGYLCWQKEGQ